MQQDVERLQCEQQETKQVQLPFRWTYSFKLLGVILACRWTFHQHLMELRGRLVRRLQALKKLSGAVWGLESRILAVTAHASIESIVQYGLATTGTHAGVQELREKGSKYGDWNEFHDTDRDSNVHGEHGNFHESIPNKE